MYKPWSSAIWKGSHNQILKGDLLTNHGNLNHLLNKMILQVQIYGLEILDHISILGYLLGMLPCLLTTYTSWDDPYAPGFCRLLDLSLRAAAKQESDMMG